MNDEERAKLKMDRSIENISLEFSPFHYADMENALSQCFEVGLNSEDLSKLIDEFKEENDDLEYQKIDICYVIYDHIFQNARNTLEQILKIDIVNDLDYEVVGESITVCYDCQAKDYEKLQRIISNCSTEQLSKIKNDIFVRSFLSDNGIKIPA